MRQFKAIMIREVKAFFHSTMAGVVLAGFLVAVGLFFTVFLLGYSEMSLTALQSARSGNYLNLAEGLFRPLVSNMTLFLLLLMPAVTMRLFSPEYSSGRYDLIASWPVPDTVWVLGKWAAALIVAAMLILASSAYFGVVWFLGDPEPGPLVAALTGLLLLSGCLAAWGLLSSTLFAHQMVAYFLAFAWSILLFIIGSLERFLPGALGQLCRELSFLSHFERFSRGVLDSRDILFFVAMTVIPLFAATSVLAGRRRPADRRLAYWAPPLLVAGVAVVVYIGGLYSPATFDLTGNQRYSLAPQTEQILDALPEDLADLAARVDSLVAVESESASGPYASGNYDHVQVYAFYQRSDPAWEAMDVLLRSCAQRSRRFRYRMADPEAELELVRKYQVTVSRSVIIEAGDRYTSVLQPEEAGLINAVYRLVTRTRPLVCHVLGHGEHLLSSEERSGYSTYDVILAEQGYEVWPLYLADLGTIPARCDVLVIAGPRTEPDPMELAALERFLGRGGAVIALLDPPTPAGWADWLQQWQVKLSGDVIITADRSGAVFGSGPRTVVVTDGYGEHEIVKSLQGIATIFPLAQPVGQDGDLGPGVSGSILMVSNPVSWAETDPDTRFTGKAGFDRGADPQGPLPLGLVLELKLRPEQEKPGRLVVIGNSEFLNNSNVNLGGNRDLMLNIFGWLSGDEALIQLRGRDPLSQPVVLSPAAKQVLGWGSVLGWPMLVGSLALGFMLRHRRENRTR